MTVKLKKNKQHVLRSWRTQSVGTVLRPFPSPDKNVHFPPSRTIIIRGKGDLGEYFVQSPPFTARKQVQRFTWTLKSWFCPAFYESD